MILQRRWLLLPSLLVAACALHGDYRIARADWDRIAADKPVDKPLGAIALAATRVDEKGRAALVRADRLLPATARVDGDAVIVRAEARAPLVTAGAILTCVGSVMSVVGTLGYLILHGGAHDDVGNALGIVELVSEPIMITGTVLWIYGVMRPPQEVRAGQPGIVYLPSGGATTGVSPTVRAASWSVRF